MGLKKPLEVKLQLTEKCNFNCSFCFNKQGFKEAAELPTKTAKKVIAAISDQGLEAIRFTGGEPLLHPNFLELLSYANKKGLYTKLNTNASLITEKNSSKIAKNCNDILISMHSINQNKATEKAISLLAKQGCFLRAATILTKQNIQSLEKFHRIVSEKPFNQWVLLRQIPNQLNKKPVEPKDMAQAVEKILSFNKTRPKKDQILIENALPFCCSNPEKVNAVSLGGIHEDGHSNLFVDTSGKIRPSYFFEIDLGNAEKGLFLEAWQSDFMKRMNSLEFIAEPCHKCKHVLKCMSGSRFAAMFAHNSLYALDPLANPNQFRKELGIAQK
jgi:radical SAM protein with 4Fe4S-binding SPASM domain